MACDFLPEKRDQAKLELRVICFAEGAFKKWDPCSMEQSSNKAPKG